jgi:hypothetical protein
MLPVLASWAQEVRCNLTVNTQQVNGGSIQLNVIENFERQVTEFINNRRWTNDVIKENEKIEFSMLINIREVSGQDAYSAEMQLSSVRPIYNSGYNSAVISHKDDNFNFQFSQMDVLNFNIQNSSENNLTAMLAYYVYLVIGYDYETFSPGGGNKYFEMANNIALQNQNSGFPGWQPLENDKNRYWIIQNMIQPRYANLGKCLYKYHREGLDKMYENPAQARKEITAAIKLLEAVYADVPDLVNIQLFFNAKATEIVGIYKEASSSEKQEIIALLDKIYPSNTQKWSQINGR